jgi:hypothetical protein
MDRSWVSARHEGEGAVGEGQRRLVLIDDDDQAAGVQESFGSRDVRWQTTPSPPWWLGTSALRRGPPHADDERNTSCLLTVTQERNTYT